ncbi:MAG: ABC transporter ATP-binding protein [Oscillospiraceae bacterium]|nr:ABC transporter ATP-binding protein [Oscillospiraceae bacterium]
MDAQTTTQVILQAEDLVKTYGKGDAMIYALNHVNLTVSRGEFVAIIGESGGGKTTLLNVIGTLDTADSGRVIFDGADLTGRNDDFLSAYRRKNIGFIFQDYNLIPVLTVEENIVLPLRLDQTPVDTAYLDELLEMIGLRARRHHYPHELSGGQQQRVSFARALIHKPQLILADEPTGNLDSKNSREIISILKDSIAKYNQTLLLVTHDGNIATQADRIFTMQDGVLTAYRG